MAMPLNKFMGRCAFYERDGKLYGSCLMRMRNGQTFTVSTKPGKGVPLAMLATKIAMASVDGEVGGLFGNVWKKARGAATAVAKKAVSKELLGTVSTLARSDLGSIALSIVPGGTAAATAIKLGTQAADLLGKAQAGSKQAKEQIQKVTALAQAGVPKAKTAHKILKAVLAKGQVKGVFKGGKSSKTTVRPGVPAGIKAVSPGTPGKRRAVARVVPVATSRFASRAPGGSGTIWAGLPGLAPVLRARVGSDSWVGDDTFPVGHWGQWDY